MTALRLARLDDVAAAVAFLLPSAEVDRAAKPLERADRWIATRLPLSLMVELAADCSTKCSVTSALMNSGGRLSSAISSPRRAGDGLRA